MSLVNRRLASPPISQEPKQFLKAIRGYEKEPSLPLELACEPLRTLFDETELDEHIQIAKLNCKNPADGLTQDESASIHLYTMEWNESSESLYAILNRTLRTPERNLLRPWFRYLKVFLTALFKLPSVKCQLWRGVKEDLSADYQKGDLRIWWSFSSCTSSLDVLQRPNFIGKKGTRTLFSIEGSTCGKDISRHSYFKHEDEILLLPGTCVEVRSLISRSDNFFLVHLRQAKPPYEVLVPPFADEFIERKTQQSLSNNQNLPLKYPQTNNDDSSDDEPQQIYPYEKNKVHSKATDSIVSNNSIGQEQVNDTTSNTPTKKKLQIQKSSKGFIDISYVDRTGNSIVIENTSFLAGNNVNMTGWLLRKTIDIESTYTYQFPDNFFVKARVPVRIIARNTTRKHTTITRRDGETLLIADTIPTWGIGQYSTTELLDDQGNEQAIYIQTFS